MNRTVKEWIAKAEGDFVSAGRELRARKKPNFDSACFHAQQCIEKLLKAALIGGQINFPKTHDLMVLYKLLPSQQGLVVQAEELRFLSRAAVAYRYPGEEATRADAKLTTFAAASASNF